MSSPTMTAAPAWSPVHRLGVLCLIAYFLMMFGRLPEVAAEWTGSGLLLSPLTLAGVLLTATLTGGWKRSIASIPGALWIAFTLWILACTPFSSWPGGSFEFLYSTYWKYAIIFFVTAAIIQTRRDLRWAMYGLAAASVVILLISLSRGTSAVDERFEVTFGTFRNSNDLATALLVTSPFLLLFAMNRRGLNFSRVVATVLLIASLVTVLKTGSRGALLCVVIVVGYTFWQASLSTKIKLAPALLLGAILFFLLLPAPLVNRYATILHLGGAETPAEFTDGSALESSQQRKEMLQLSLQLTLEHPLFGVGPGAFVYAVDEMYKNRGEKSPWMQSHNAYTQVSSETGIIGLIIYAALLAYCFFQNYGLYRRSRRVPEQAGTAATAFCLLLAVFAFGVCATFASIAYMGYLPLLAALTAAHLRVTAAEALPQTRTSLPPWPASSLPSIPVRTPPAAALPPRSSGSRIR